MVYISGLPVEVLRTEIAEETSLDLMGDDSTYDRWDTQLRVLLASVPESQPVERRVSEDADWLFPSDAVMTNKFQEALIRGVVTGASANRPLRPKVFVRDIERSLLEMDADASSAGSSDLAEFRKILRKGRRGRLLARNVNEHRIVAWCSKLDVDPLRLVDAWRTIRLRSLAPAEHALLQGGEDDEWARLRQRVENVLADMTFQGGGS